MLISLLPLVSSMAKTNGVGIPKPVNSELQHVYDIGDLPLLNVSPDFYPDAEIQLNNDNPKIKIKPKTSNEIKSNYVGSTPPRLPRTEAFDLQPFKRVHLIDGDRNTLWMNRGQGTPDAQPEWVRIDLPYEMPIKQVKIWPIDPKYGGWPEDLTIQVSRTASDWITVYHSSKHKPLTEYNSVDFSFDTRPVKQILITAKNLRVVRLGAAAGAVSMGFGFCISGVEVINDKGENVALLTRGAGVTVSSTNYGYGDKRSIHDMLWPIHYDLGIKHMKIAYWDDTLNWHYLEIEKGVYKVDPRTDEAITDSVNNGVNVYMTLCYGNWLYADKKPSEKLWDFWQFPFQAPPVPVTNEQIEAFCNYCKFVVNHFKGRIKYYEIWNEQNIGYSWPVGQVESFSKLVKAAAKAVKEADPEAKIMLGGVCFTDIEYFEKMFKAGVAEVVDVICWHPYQWEVAPEEAYMPSHQRSEESRKCFPDICEADKKKFPYKNYREVVAKIKELAVKYGFRGNEYHANETTWVSPYPIPSTEIDEPKRAMTEMVKAKYVARTIALHADMDIPVYYNETWNTGIVYWDVSVLRATFSADPASPVWTQPVYYSLRTMATLTDTAQPDSDLEIKVEGVDVNYETSRLKLADGSKLVGFWLTQRGKDIGDVYPAKITIVDHKASKVTGIDPINGTEQELCFDKDKGNVVVPDVMVTDYPIILKIE